MDFEDDGVKPRFIEATRNVERRFHDLGKIDIKIRAGDIHDGGWHDALRKPRLLLENRATVPSAS